MYIANGNWCNVNYAELWNKGNTIYTLNNNPVVKTIYDPLPYMFSLPCPAAFSNFSINNSPNSTGFSNGHYFYTTGTSGATIFFPAIGDRTFANGTVQEYNEVGDYMTSGPIDSRNSTFMYFTENTTRIHEINYKAFAFTIFGNMQQ